MVVVAAAMVPMAPAAVASAPPMTVALHQPSGLPLSYFDLKAKPGRPAAAGTLELSNRSSHRITVLLDPVDATTASTLGSAYEVRGLPIDGPSRWTRLSVRRVELAPHATTSVAVSVEPPENAKPGDYLTGIGVQALGGSKHERLRANVAVSSVQRYAVGLEVRLPGPRDPLIRLTGATVKRDPAGITFSLLGSNDGNVILQDVHGRVLITDGSRVVAREPLGPGTFVTGTSIAYPIPTPREEPREGTAYRVRAALRYRGGVARLDTVARFGQSDAERQQDFGGPAVANGGGLPALVVALAALVLALAAIVAARLLQRRRSGERSPLRALERAMAATRASGEPLSVIVVTSGSNGASVRQIGSILRARLRRTDRLCRFGGGGFLVVAPETDAATADALAADLRRQLERANGGPDGVAIEAHAVNGDGTATTLLERLSHPGSDDRQPQPTR
jgi:hypothetical protein